MHKTNFLVGMGIGVAVGSLAGMTVSGTKRLLKHRRQDSQDDGRGSRCGFELDRHVIILADTAENN